MQSVVLAWHEAVDAGDRDRAIDVVGDPVVVLGPRGAGPISPTDFADWIDRSGIRLEPRSWHAVSDELVVVEQDATWPTSPEPTRVATVFRVRNGHVTAALRLPTLQEALDLATILREMSATA